MLQTIIINKVDILLNTETKLDYSFPSNHLGTRIDNLFIESNLRLKKWLIYGSYNPHVM